MEEALNPPRVFLSYSWDSDEHKNWVRALAERLTKNGVNARLDQWHITPGQSLTQFMETEAQSCDYALIICTRDYCRKSLNRVGGVGYEQQIISGHIAAGMSRDRFIPIIRDGEFNPGPSCAIPAQFLGTLAIDMRNDEHLDQRIEELLRAIFKEPALKPPAIGQRPIFGIKAASKINEGIKQRLAVIDIDGWHLLSGVASNERWPKTFTIPEESERYSLKVGDTVKLQFEFSLPDEDDENELFGERMWVDVTGSSGPYLIGELVNMPCCSDEQNNLKAGDTIVFLPEHVIDIWDE
ncbi:toll/interleukin-1 receptor domain-containing protein [Ectopseudomonas mendocina]|uniref:toll/interleukin-1 receptor domain-containing protein n=1 Tax=Ectopseudomonas mendocina TaxID=300 RepID=UPI001ADFCCCE|nr:toll/interleukin-1 receptor domain-containing protein [Pseudomonas mendocina]QTN48180.1 toll/interleukin-1 receptor domain-containing protein [Pseudomonas mendocina]